MEARPGDLIVLVVQMLYDHPYGATMRGEARICAASVAEVERMVYVYDKATDDRVIRTNRERFAYAGGHLTRKGSRREKPAPRRDGDRPPVPAGPQQQGALRRLAGQRIRGAGSPPTPNSVTWAPR